MLGLVILAFALDRIGTMLARPTALRGQVLLCGHPCEGAWARAAQRQR